MYLLSQEEWIYKGCIKMNNWISVNDRLPEAEISVLIYVPSYNEIHTAQFCNWEDSICNDWHISFGKRSYETLTFQLNEVSHWMELPNPPEIDK